jgi:acid phosphatase
MVRKLAVLVALACTALAVTAMSGSASPGNATRQKLDKINHIVVIYEENHSFDNLYGGWEGVNGLAHADVAHTTQVAQNGSAYKCLKQDDVNLTSPPLAADVCSTALGDPYNSHFANAPFDIGTFIPPSATTCPKPLKAFSFPNGILNGATNPDGSLVGLPGGCTRDIVHRYYQEIFQLDGGRQDRYVTGSDAIGLTMGTYDTRSLPIYRYLHSPDHPHYAIEDNFFQAAFGGSFLNHQWLIAARTPDWPGIPTTQHAILDTNGFPNATYPLYTPTSSVRDGAGTQACAPDPTFRPGFACGDFAVNTTQPPFQPSGLFGAKLPAQTNPTIGDRLTGAGVDWAWYSGGWSNANGDVGAPGWTNGTAPSSTATGCSDPNVDPGVSHWPECPDNLFQYHHQPFNYFADFSTATSAGLANRATHLKDEQEFIQLAQSSSTACNLKPVSFIKPIGEENEHPGYASEPNGSDHLVSLLQSIENSRCAKDTMVIVTYDEFGGQWDHVPPPGQGNDNGPHDIWGPGTRVPALVISPHIEGTFVVDNAEHDTTSILATIEHRYGLAPLGTRDAAVNDLSTAFDAKHPSGAH